MALTLSSGQKLHSPEGLTARPTTGMVRQAVMNILAADLPGCRWLDLCSGSGAMACEALLHGADWVLAVEADRRIAGVCQRNLEGLGERFKKRWQLRNTSVEQCLAEPCSAPFDLIYADPPYAADLYGPISELVACHGWLHPGGQLLLECERHKKPELPVGWHEKRERRYGRTLLLQWQLN